MRSRSGWLCWVTTLCLATSCGGRAKAGNYNEMIQGDLSGNVNAPTNLGDLDAGDNTLSATFGGGDFDLFTFAIGAGDQLDSILLNSYSGASLSFTGLQSGSVWTARLGGSVNAAVLLGWTHIAGDLVGTNILDDMGNAPFAIGFDPPLSAGNYTMEMQDTGSAVSASVTLHVTAPAPPVLVGDANGDCLVGAADYATWAAQFGQTGELSADFDANGSVGAGDYALWAANFGNTCQESASTAPEPSTGLLLCSGLAAGALIRRGQKRVSRRAG